MSCPQAWRWKSAKNRDSARHWSGSRIFFKPATHPHGRWCGATSRNRWNDAETTESQHGCDMV
nr:MAG TPA: hypothetical protein [Caudoviricetes sp.]